MVSSLRKAFGTVSASRRLVPGGLLLLAGALLASGAHAYDLEVSTSSNRSSPALLEGYTASGNIYVFVTPASGLKNVRFWYDDPTTTGSPDQNENFAPWDFAGGSSNNANAFDTTGETDGQHTITAIVRLQDNSEQTITSTFTIANGSQPDLVFNSGPLNFPLTQGGSPFTQTINLSASDAGAAAFTITSSETWLTTAPTTGTTSQAIDITADPAGLVPGIYSATLTATAPGYDPATLSVTADVSEPSVADQIHLSWTDDPTTTLTVVWHTRDTAAPSEAQVRPAGGGAWTTVAGGTRTAGVAGLLHEVTFTGLSADSEYDYRLRNNATDWSAVRQARTAPAAGGADLTVAFVADTGLIGRTDGLDTGTQQVIDEIAALDPRMVLLGGDYAYYNTEQDRFDTLDEAIDAWFLQLEPVGARAPMMPTYGNHEVVPSLDENFDDWKARFATPAGIEGGRFYSFDVGNVHFVSILAPQDSGGLTAAQLSWIDADIAAARSAGAAWIVPFMHVPSFGDGTNHPDNLQYRNQLGPIFESHGVELVLTTHDQAFERSYPLSDIGVGSNSPTSDARSCYTTADGVVWLKSSPGGKLSNISLGFSPFGTTPPPDWTATRDNTLHHFSTLTASGDGSTLTAETWGVKGDGSTPLLQDSFTITTGACGEELRFSTTESVTFDFEPDQSDSRLLTLDTSDAAAAGFTIAGDTSWLTVNPGTGTAGDTITLVADATGLADGDYHTLLVGSSAGYEDARVTVSMTVSSAPTYEVRYSTSPDRSGDIALDGATVAGNAYIFTLPEDANIDTVEFWVDDPSASGAPDKVEGNAPYDLAGSNFNGTAKPWDSTLFADGAHSVTARVTLSDNTEFLTTAFFTVANNVPSLTATPAVLNLSGDADGPVATADVLIGADDASAAAFSIVSDAAWLTAAPTSGTTQATVTVTADPTGLSGGVYNGTLTASAAGYNDVVIDVQFTVTSNNPLLTFSPGTLSLVGESGGPTVEDTSIVSASDASSTLFNLSSSEGWLSVPAQANTGDSITATADPSGLAPGNYSATVTASAAGYDNGTLNVDLQVTASGGGTYTVLLSLDGNRSNPVPLDGATVAGDIFAFISPETSISQVLFYYDDPTATGTADQTENSAPYDAAGTFGNGTAKPLDTTTVFTDGSHSITALVRIQGGGTELATAVFDVANNIPSLTATPSTVGLTADLDGAPVQTDVTLGTDDASPASWSVTSSAGWLSGSPGSGTTPSTLTVTADPAGLGAGGYAGTLTVSAPGYVDVQVNVDLTVTSNQPALIYSPAGIAFTADESGSPVQQNVSLDASDASAAAYSLNSSAAWLSADPTAGSTPGTITVTATPDGLLPGTYNATLTATAAGYDPDVLDVTLTVQAIGGGGNYDLSLSLQPNRSGAISLQGTTVAGDIYVFTSPEAGAQRVDFYLDDPGLTGAPFKMENNAPFDLAGSSGANANPYDTNVLADGVHNISAEVFLIGGGSEIVSANFTVANNVPALTVTPATLSMSGFAGSGPVEQFVNLDTNDATTANFTVTSSAGWLSGSPPSGSTPQTITVSADPTNLTPGNYSGTLTFSAPGYADSQVGVNFDVDAQGGCFPIDCQLALVSLPYVLDFESDAGFIQDGLGVGTGFTWLDEPSQGNGYLPANLDVNTGTGRLNVTATSGLAFTGSNSQDNGIGVGIDAPSQVTKLSAVVVDLPLAEMTGNSQQVGLWFGNNEDNYVKLVLISTGQGMRFEHVMEESGVKTFGKLSAVQNNLAGATVELILKANPFDRTISTYYSINGGTETFLASEIAPTEFFSFDAAGIDPEIGTRSFGGILTSFRNGPAPLTYVFEEFRAEADSLPPPPGGDGTVVFTKVPYDLTFPTNLVYASDGRLYVTSLLGDISALTYDADWNVTGEQMYSDLVNDLGPRLTLGIAEDPDSTPSEIILWIAHSSPSLNNGAVNSSMVSRFYATGPSAGTLDHVITGLPRAKANHSINSIHFGPDNRLYIAHGGNTGAGAPTDDPSSEFGTRKEQPLTASINVADVKNPSFDGTCLNESDPFGPNPCDVVTFSTGLRNAYDFAFHSNGTIYATDNGLGVAGAYPPSPVPPCDGFGDTRPISEGGDNPGDQPDLLVKIEDGNYLGHPNPSRDECVFKDGSLQGVAPLPNYVPPVAELGNNLSANGIIEYSSPSACGGLEGQLLIANYSVGDDVITAQLTPDGNSLESQGTLVGGFSNPLPLGLGPAGVFFVGEFGGDRVTALVPESFGCWRSGLAAPVSVLDPGAAQVNGRMYMVGGKNPGGHLTSLFIYDTVTDMWSQGADLPGIGVENPAVVAYGGEIYVFGGSPAPFSGATTNAAVYNPGTDSWTSLTPMPAGRSGSVAQEIGGLIYVAGGLDPTGMSKEDLFIYNPATNTWSTGASMGTRRDHAGSAAIDGKLYAFGGRIRNTGGQEVDPTLSSAEVYDPVADAWSPIAPMPTGRRTMVAGTLNGKVQLMGGERKPNGDVFSEAEEYDPATDSWRTLTEMQVPRHGAAYVTIGDSVYTVGGGTEGGASYTSIMQIFEF